LKDVFSGPGLALTIGLIGFMPAGMDASAFSSFWSIEKMRATGYHPTLRESLFDFQLGYVFTTLIALMFVVIGAFTIYGTGEHLEGNSVEFSNKLLAVLKHNLGEWSHYIIAIAAFGTIYGTLITVWDGFARVGAEAYQLLRTGDDAAYENSSPSKKHYTVLIFVIGLGAYALLYQFSNAMIKLLDLTTIILFTLAPLICYMNLRVIRNEEVPASHRPGKLMMLLAYFGLFVMIVVSVYYFVDLLK
jgi:Mn2+/Fe2+ NRAMP family transporter